MHNQINSLVSGMKFSFVFECYVVLKVKYLNLQVTVHFYLGNDEKLQHGCSAHHMSDDVTTAVTDQRPWPDA